MIIFFESRDLNLASGPLGFENGQHFWLVPGSHSLSPTYIFDFSIVKPDAPPALLIGPLTVFTDFGPSLILAEAHGFIPRVVAPAASPFFCFVELTLRVKAMLCTFGRFYSFDVWILLSQHYLVGPLIKFFRKPVFVFFPRLNNVINFSWLNFVLCIVLLEVFYRLNFSHCALYSFHLQKRHLRAIWWEPIPMIKLKLSPCFYVRFAKWKGNSEMITSVKNPNRLFRGQKSLINGNLRFNHLIWKHSNSQCCGVNRKLLSHSRVSPYISVGYPTHQEDHQISRANVMRLYDHRRLPLGLGNFLFDRLSTLGQNNGIHKKNDSSFSFETLNIIRQVLSQFRLLHHFNINILTNLFFPNSHLNGLIGLANQWDDGAQSIHEIFVCRPVFWESTFIQGLADNHSLNYG